MSKEFACFLSFILGGAIGAGVAAKLVADYYEAEITAEREYTSKKMEEQATEVAPVNDEPEEEWRNINHGYAMLTVDYHKKKSNLKEVAEETKDKDLEQHLAERESPSEEDEECDEALYAVLEMQSKEMEEKVCVRHQTPYPITPDEFSNELMHFDKLTLSWYEGDKSLCDEREELIPDVRAIIGDIVMDPFPNPFGDETVLYVRNVKMHTDFEIVLEHGSYSEIVLGMIPEKKPKTRKRVRKVEDGED